MSRSNCSVVRNMRDNENLQVRKTILKASGTAARQERIASAVLAAGDTYLHKIAALDKFKKTTKQKTKLGTHRMDWFQETDHLSGLAKRVEKSIGELLQGVMMSCPQEAHVLQDVLTEAGRLEMNRHQFQRSAFSQIQDMKALLRDQKRKRREDQNEAEVHDISSAVFADVFLKLRNSLADYWNDMKQEEKDYSADVVSARKLLLQSTSAYSAQVAALSQLEHFTVSEEDPVEVKLLQEEWQKNLNDFDSRLDTDLKMIWSDWAALCNTQFKCDPASSRGNWAEEDHTIFAKIYARFKVTGMSRQRMSTQMAAELPHKTQLEISQHEDWYAKYKSYHKKHKDVGAAYNMAERQALVSKGKEALDQCRLKCIEAEAVEKELSDREATRLRLHRLLSEQRQRLTVIEAEERQAELLALSEMKNVEEKRQVLREKEIVRKKELLAEYRHQRALEDERQQQDRRELQRRQEELRKAKVDAERGNIERRNVLFLEKQAEKRCKEEEYLRSEVRLTELLVRLAAQVPYYEKIQNAQSKLDHVTASAKAHEYHGAEEATRGHISMNGFTDKAVFKDARFRLGLQLRAAGVHQSEAARQKIAELHPRAQAPF